MKSTKLVTKSLKNVLEKYVSKHKHFNFPHFEQNWNMIASQLSQFGGISGGNKVLLYKNQDNVFEDMWKEIDNAKHRILLETYIFEPDAIGNVRRIILFFLTTAKKKKKKSFLIFFIEMK